MKKLKKFACLFSILSIFVLPFSAFASITFDPPSPQPLETPMITATCSNEANYFLIYDGADILQAGECLPPANIIDVMMTFWHEGEYHFLEMDSSYPNTVGDFYMDYPFRIDAEMSAYYLSTDIFIIGSGGETCWDGIQNQDETGIDTGGVCGAPLSFDPPSPQVQNTAITINCSNEANYFYQYWTGILMGGFYCDPAMGENTLFSAEVGEQHIVQIGSGYPFDPMDTSTFADRSNAESSAYYISTDTYTITLLETCSDGIQNQDETGIDYGGVCGFSAPLGTGIGIFTPPVEGGTYGANDMMGQTAMALGATMGGNGLAPIVAIIAGIILAIAIGFWLVRITKEADHYEPNKTGR